MSIALETNVLVRFLTQDCTEQLEIAQDVINSCSVTQPAFICGEVLVELVGFLNVPTNTHKVNHYRRQPVVVH